MPPAEWTLILDGVKYTVGPPEDGAKLAAFLFPADESGTKVYGFRTERNLLGWLKGHKHEDAIKGGLKRQKDGIARFRRMSPVELAQIKQKHVAAHAEAAKKYFSILKSEGVDTADVKGIARLAKKGIVGSVSLYNRGGFGGRSWYFHCPYPYYCYYDDLNDYGCNNKANSVWNFHLAKAAFLFHYPNYRGWQIIVPPACGFLTLYPKNNMVSSLQI